MHISEDILRRASQGDVQAFETIYQAMSGFVYYIALRVVNNRDDAREVTQEVFLTVHEKLKTFRSQASLKTWIYRVALNRAINFAKKAARDRHHVPYEPETSGAATAVNPMGAEMDREHYGNVIEELLGHINTDEKACVLLRNIEGLSYRQIAEVLRVNVNTVRSRLKRAREKMLSFRRAAYERL